MFIKHPWHNGPKDTPPNCVVTGDWQELITINYLPNSYSCTKIPNIHNSNWSFNINYRAFTPSTYFGTYSYCAHMVANHIKMPIYPLLDALQHFGTTIAPKPSWPHVTFQTLIINHMISKLRIHLQSSTLKIEEIEVEGCCSQGSCFKYPRSLHPILVIKFSFNEVCISFSEVHERQKYEHHMMMSFT